MTNWEYAFPFGPAENFTNAGYRFAYIVDDGEALCAECVNDPTNPVHSHPLFSGMDDGWNVQGVEILEGTVEDYGPIDCAHCAKALV